MTITVNPSRNEYTATASQTVFNYTFKIYSVTDLNVYVTPTGQTANDATDIITAYTVDPGTIEDPAGGFITLTTPSTLNDLVTIVSAIPSTRVVDYQFNGDFDPDTVNLDIDRTVSLDKQTEDLSSRTVTFQESEQGTSGLTLPKPVVGNFLKWNAGLTGLDNATVVTAGDLTVTPYMETLLDDPTAGDARTTLAISALNTPYDNTTSGLTATEVKGALDEMLTSIEADNVAYDNTTSGLTATDVNAAIDELEEEIDAMASNAVQAIKTSAFTSTVNATWTDITGMSVTITPTATSSDVDVSCSLSTGNGGNNLGRGYRILRGSTVISEGDAATGTETMFGGVTVEAQAIDILTFSIIDSPSTTSATTYKVQFFNPPTSVTGVFINRAPTQSIDSFNGVSIIKAKEIIQ